MVVVLAGAAVFASVTVELAAAPETAVASVDAAVVLAAWPFCACSAAIRLCMKADMACWGSWVEDVPPVEALALVLVPLLDALVLSPTPSWLSAWKMEPNRVLLDEVLPVWLVVLLAAVLLVDGLAWLS